MEMEVNLEEVKKLVQSSKFAQFLLNNTVDFSSAAFILEVLLSKIEELEG